MSSTSTPDDRNKGKARAQLPDERTPLLDGESSALPEQPPPPTTRRRLWSKLLRVFLLSLALCIIIFAVLALLAYSYAARASNLSPETVLHSALTVRGPDRVDVRSIDDDGVLWVDVVARVGVDAGAVIGVNEDPDDGFWHAVWKTMGRWGVRKLHTVTVTLTTINTTTIRGDLLASLNIPPLELPLTVNPSADWLTAITIPVAINPTKNASVLVHFVQDSWRDGEVVVQTSLERAVVRGGSLGGHSWRQRLGVDRSNVRAAIRIKIPPIPGLPSPGRGAPFPAISELVTLQTFSVATEENGLALHARATVVDPAPLTFNLTSPSLPFTISLPASPAPVGVAAVSTAPFSLTHPNITLLIAGTVLPLHAEASSTLSAFLTRYLSAEASPILISTPLLPGLTIDTVFPAPNPKPHVLRNVTIRDMKIKPPGSGPSFLASGTVFAQVVLPKGMNIGLDVRRVLPDVLIFDGEVPDSVELPDRAPVDDGPPAHPLPDPLPERAFGHLRPDDWLAADSVPQAPGDEGAVFAVTATIVDVPLQVLPGRQKEFSNFVGKVIFGSGGAVAGILGTAAVAVNVHGWPVRDGEDDGEGGTMELDGLPFRGSVRIGKKSMLDDAWTYVAI